MRLDYYSGMDTYIFQAANNLSLSMVPVYTTMTCLKTVAPVSLQAC